MTQPWLFDARNSLGVGVFAHRRSVPGIVIDRGVGANASVTRRVAERTPVSLTYRFEKTIVEAGEVYFCVNFGVCQPGTIGALQGSQRLSPLGLSAFADRTDDPLEPRSGFSARLDAEHASAATISDFRYNRISGEAARYMRVGRGVLAARVRGGGVQALASTAEAVGIPDSGGAILHPRKRFYSGGARSVRGYGENQLGPRILTISDTDLRAAQLEAGAAPCSDADIVDGSCDPGSVPSTDFLPRPLGGNTLVEASVEYRFPIWNQFVGAVFVDGARVGDSGLNVPQGARQAITPGFGIRYRSPIGPVRVDLGVRPKLTEDLPVVTQVRDENGELRLVQLRTLKRYNPLEESGPFWKQVLTRLQLHLAIGEAF
jgi:outer membrane protein assembly factor BamA